MDQELEFPRPLDVSNLEPEGKTELIAATEAECDAITRRFGVVHVKELTATVHVAPWKRGGIRARGSASALVSQVCVITLDEFDSQVEASLDRIFVERTSRWSASSGAEILVSVDDDDISTIVDGCIDLGELALEELLLELDPYPKKPGAQLPEHATSSVPGDDGREARPNPFAVLRQLKLNDEK